MNNVRGSHVSPGIYMKEIDVTYAPKSMGITTLGLVGETLKGPAFQPVSISDWGEFVDYFGGTSAEKDANKKVKYELPYIAKEYLKESKQLEVTRVLGLSGYNAGPAWVLSVNLEGEKPLAFALLRSKGIIKEMGTDLCIPEDERAGEDCVDFIVKDIAVQEITEATYTTDCSTGEVVKVEGEKDPRRFKLVISYNTINDVERADDEIEVSLIPSDPSFILKVFGTSPLLGKSEVFVEEYYESLFDEEWERISEINCKAESKKKVEIKATKYPENGSEVFEGFATAAARGASYTEDDLGKRYLGEKDAKIWTVAKTEKSVSKDKGEAVAASTETKFALKESADTVSKEAYQNVGGELYRFKTSSWVKDTTLASNTMSNYMSSFKWATTPWFVSEARGNGLRLDVRRLFRFHTISDGNAANTHVKVSISNVDPSNGTFDVLIRDYFDTDANPVILESFMGCTMDPQSDNYIALRIGTIDNTYEVKSKYVMLEMIEDEELYHSVPAGFLGYPLRSFGEGFRRSEMKYNLEIHPEIKEKRQYFGLSDIAGMDTDAFQYKGEENNPEGTGMLCPGFHLDERLSKESAAKNKLTITVDGVPVGDNAKIPSFKTPTSKGTGFVKAGVIFTKEAMKDTIYENKAMRKFTACPFGGFDGWDIYRAERTNKDAYRFDRYAGAFYKRGLPDNVFYPHPEKANRSDYYAYLAGYYTMSNPEEIDINLFTTPGIDWLNNTQLTKDAIEMVEDFEEGRGGDAFYVVTSPETIEGAEGVSDIASSLVEKFEYTGIDTSYAGTFWPWIKCYDSIERTYVDLPVTKDLVRNLAYIDNNLYPWFAPAGKTERGKIDCVRATYATRINEEDTLYEGLINPVKTFAVDGVKIWGNKTMYSIDSPLNRINVRRLMIRIKKLISRACGALIFEPNDMTVRNQFLSIVNPILEDIRSNRGITDYKVQVDNSIEAIDEHTLPAKIWIKPTPTLEYIELTFVITPQGASFED